MSCVSVTNGQISRQTAIAREFPVKSTLSTPFSSNELRWRDSLTGCALKTAVATTAVASLVLALASDTGSASQMSPALQVSSNCIENLVLGSLGMLVTGSAWAWVPSLVSCLPGVDAQNATEPGSGNSNDEQVNITGVVVISVIGMGLVGVIICCCYGVCYLIKRKKTLIPSELNHMMLQLDPMDSSADSKSVSSFRDSSLSDERPSASNDSQTSLT